MRFYQGAAGAVSLQPIAGNVGIGQTAPAYNLDVSGSGRFTGDVSLNQRLYVNRDVSMNGNLQIAGSLVVPANSIAASAIIGGVGGGSNFTTDISGTNRLFVASDVSFNRRLQVGGDVSMNGTLQIAGNLVVPANSIPASAIIGGGGGGSNFTADVSGTNRLFIASDVSFNRRLQVGGDVSMNSNMQIRGNIIGDVSLNNRLYVTADASFNGNLQIKGSLIVPIGSIPSSAISGGAGSGTNFITDISGLARLYIAADTSLNGNLQVGAKIGIGTSINTSYALDISGAVRSNNQFTGTAFSATSDYRIKSNPISMFDPSINKLFTIDELNPVYYYNTIAKKSDIGFIAHELQEHIPILVSGNKDGDEFQSVNYLGLTTILVKEIQELKRRVADLEERLK